MSERITPNLTFVLAQESASAFEAALGAIRGGLQPRILAKNKAASINLEDIAGKNAAQHFQTLRSDYHTRLREIGVKADVCVQNARGMKKSLLICDMDSTLIGQECIDELADFAGVKDRVSAITERAMRGEIGFDGALKERVGLLRGLKIDVLQRCFEERITLNGGARTLCQTMKANGAKTAIVSGGFTFFTGQVAALCGFEHHQANHLIDENGALTGAVGTPILGRQAKFEALMKYSGGAPLGAIAIGDGANDLAMIEAAGLGIAYDAKPAVAAAAHCAIDHTDLTTALYFQGYKQAEFVES